MSELKVIPSEGIWHKYVQFNLFTNKCKKVFTNLWVLAVNRRLAVMVSWPPYFGVNWPPNWPPRFIMFYLIILILYISHCQKNKY